MQAADILSCKVGKKAACEAMGLCRASFYRSPQPGSQAEC